MKPIPLLTFEGYDPGPRGAQVFGRLAEKTKTKRSPTVATAKQKAARERFKKAAKACRTDAKQGGPKAFRACIADKLKK